MNIAFQGPREPYRGFTVRASFVEGTTDALVELFRDGQPVRRFSFPAYKVYNVQAHFRDIVDAEIEGTTRGIEIAAWSGLHDSTVIIPIRRLS